MKARYSDYFEVARKRFLTKAFPADATEWDDFRIRAFIEDNVSEEYQDWYWATIYEHIEGIASEFWYELKEIKRSLNKEKEN